MSKKEILKKLNNAIADLTIEGISNLDLYVAGSAAMILRSATFRGTMDIDLAKAVVPKVKEILFEYQINDHMATSSDPNISDDLEYIEEASDLIIDSKGIRVYLVWQELVLILKGYHADREKDVLDVKAMVGKLDSNRLDKSLELIIKSRERFGQKEPFVGEFEKVVNELKGGK